jgi:small subunit ribosomal protein S4e
MVKSHLKRISAPKSWSIKRKTTKWIVKPRPGPHSIDSSISLDTLFKELLNYTETARETKKILNEGNVLINGIPRRDPKFPAGVLDTINLPTKETFRLLYNKQGRLVVSKINAEESFIIPRKIIKKTYLRKKNIQLNLNDGTNILVSKDSYKIGDTLIIEKDKIKSHLKFEKGAYVYLIKGKYRGTTATVQEIKKVVLQPTLITIKTPTGSVDTLKDYAIVIGKEKPIISL